jgi:benzoyl-CoA reductase subunit C
MEKFKEWYEKRHEYAKEWKEKKKGKIIGYFCTYLPEEILYAANILPVRILGSHEPQSVTEPHIFGMFCPFCRDCLAQGLKGKYDYLDGIVIAQSCLHIRQAYSSWTLHIGVDYDYYIPMPNNVQSRHAYKFLEYELKELKKSLEKWLGYEIEEKKIKEGIELVNENRRLLKEIYELKKKQPTPITGLETMYMVVSSQLVDKREHNRELEKILVKKKEEREKGEEKIRLIILGSENDDIQFVKMVEELDAVFVIDDHCTGSRYFWKEVEDGEVLYSLAKRYVDRVPCPSKDWPERRRVKHILNLVQEYNVQGAILIQQKFCDPHELDIPVLKKELEKNNIHTLVLEFDVTVPVGQFKTRVEAFLEEMSMGEELF